MNNLFFNQIEENDLNKNLIEQLNSYIEKYKENVYLINKPLGKKEYKYSYENSAVVLLIPKHTILVIDLQNSEEDFQDYYEDFLEDLASLSDKFEYKDFIQRPRNWKKDHLVKDLVLEDGFDIEDIIKNHQIADKQKQRKCELLISLLTGSINNISQIGVVEPETLLEKVKNKIVLFDAEQTRFIYKKLNQKVIKIQGLSGTGKTELLLHKIKELYLESEKNKIFFTCHNKILASTLKKRIPEFFNFMKVEKQIKWDEVLWVTNAWGSGKDIDSGVYRYICGFYDLDFFSWSHSMSFDKACKNAIEELNKLPEIKPAFDYILIDESQDFPESFFDLCTLVTAKNIYIAGDIFQDIFEHDLNKKIVNIDFILNRCYRTDPRTLMFAHGTGMGLFENTKLNWLTNEEWDACGYIVNKNDKDIFLSREPIRRFEDLELEDFESIVCEYVDDSIENKVLDIIKNIKEQNSSVEPDDIAIIFLDNDKYIYEMANRLSNKIVRDFEWETNKGYDSKIKMPNTIFMSNRNNVKGLEFPFVICITNKIKNDLQYRNTLYTMLTRSFIQSYLLTKDHEKIIELQKGLKIINDKKYILTTEPSFEEKQNIKKTIIEYKEDSGISYKDFLTKIFNSEQIGSKCRKKLEKMISELLDNTFDKEQIIEFINKNKEYCEDERV
ncbi:DEAD/DEAH box helicase [Aliarcobacter skirrowii]|uniref:DEAD/DEAH box helicase n=1 Tax=Aliarcobacter skirrowii TaxID=28200 RepID=UPI00082A80FC|nr:ATP-binding domain-containing protein [Aliarcobacter skirrowii]